MIIGSTLNAIPNATPTIYLSKLTQVTRTSNQKKKHGNKKI